MSGDHANTRRLRLEREARAEAIERLIELGIEARALHWHLTASGSISADAATGLRRLDWPSQDTLAVILGCPHGALVEDLRRARHTSPYIEARAQQLLNAIDDGANWGEAVEAARWLNSMIRRR